MSKPIGPEDIWAAAWISDDGKVWHKGTATGTACGAEVEGEMGDTRPPPENLRCRKCLEKLERLLEQRF